MKRKSLWALLSVLAVLAVMIAPVTAFVKPSKITDPTNDTDNAALDLVKISISEKGGNFNITFEMAGGDPSAWDAGYYLFFDTDRNPATGSIGWWSGIGPEYWAFCCPYNNKATLYTGNSSVWVSVKTLAFSVSRSTITVWGFSKADLGLKSIAKVDVASYTYYKGVKDRAPDSGVVTLTIIG
jgi:hypothetical protein